MRLLQMQNVDVQSDQDMVALHGQRLYGEMILAIGNGKHWPNILLDGYVSDKSRGSTTIELPGCRRIVERKDAISYVFQPPINPETLSKNAILAGTNEQVDKWKEEVQKLKLFPTVSLASHDDLAERDHPHKILGGMLTDDVLHYYNKNRVPPH